MVSYLVEQYEVSQVNPRWMLRQSTRLHCEILPFVPDGAKDLLQDTVNATLLFCGATGQPLLSSPLFWADKWFSLLPLIRAFLPIHQLSIPGFTQKGWQKQRLWHTGQKYQHNLLTQTNENSPMGKVVLSHFSHHFISWDNVWAENRRRNLDPSFFRLRRKTQMAIRKHIWDLFSE